MADNNIFSQVTESGNYEPISSQSGLDELIAEVNQKQAGGKRRGRPARKVSKKGSKKSSRKMSGGKRRKSSKKASKKSSKKASRKMSGGKKRASKKASKKMSKKHSRKASKKMSTKGGKKSRKSSKKSSRRSSATPKRSLPPAVKSFSEFVQMVAKDKDIDAKYPVAMKICALYKNDIMKDNNLDSMESINRAKKDWPKESEATKRKYLNKAQKEIDDKKSAKKANKN